MNRTRTILSLTSILIAVAILLNLKVSTQEVEPKFDEYMNAITKQDRFRGAVLVARDGRVIFNKAYGTANLEWNIHNTPQTKFRLGSITKQFTAAAILLLQERGKLTTQVSVCKYVESCPGSWNEVTVHHLLTHTGGVPSFTGFRDYRETMMIPTTVEALVGRFKDKPLEFKPGEKMNYSNSGYVLLGYIIEKVAGESYETFLQKNIFDPLKMADSGYDTHDKILKYRATGYSNKDGKTINSLPIDMTIPHAAGALYSTVEDLFKWNEALYSDKLLSAKSREVMMTAVKNNYAYGLVVDTKFNRKMVSHGGGINGFNTFLARFPEEKITIAVLRNADFGSPGPGRITQDLTAILFGEKYEIPRERVVAKVDPKIYDAYTGQYELTPDFIITITREGDRLIGQPTNQPKVELLPESETKFFIKEVDAQVTFVKGENGQITHLILHQGGDREAKKIK